MTQTTPPSSLTPSSSLDDHEKGVRASTHSSRQARVLLYSSERVSPQMPARQALYLAALLENSRLNLSILAPNGSALSDVAKEQDLLYFPISEFGRSLLRRTPQLWPILTAMRRHSFDLAITHDGYAARGLSHIAKRVIGLCHDDDVEQFKAVDELLVLSSGAADKAKMLLGEECHIQSLPYPYHCTRKQLKPVAADRPLTIGTSARLEGESGVAVFLHMAQLLVQERPDIRFLLAGDGPQDQELKELAEQIAPFVDFAGDLDPSELAKEIDIYCQTSREEPFGLILCAMMERGIACVSTCTNGAMDILKGGMIAPLAPVDDALALTERVLELVEQPERLNAVKLACFNRIREEDFDASLFASRLNHTVGTALSRRS